MRVLVVNQSFYSVLPPKQVLTTYFDKFKPQKLVWLSFVRIENLSLSMPALHLAEPLAHIKKTVKKTLNSITAFLFGALPTVSILAIGIIIYSNNRNTYILVITGLICIISIWIGNLVYLKILKNGIIDFLKGNNSESIELEEKKINKEKLIEAASKTELTEKFKYKFIPTRNENSKDFMIEFCDTKNTNMLIGRILMIIDSIGFDAGETQELIDEIWIRATSKNGQIIITWDIWDLVFILGENNRIDLIHIENEMNKSEHFIRIE